MKINNNINFGIKQNKETPEAHKNIDTKSVQKSIDARTVNPQEYIGRSQVNFRGNESLKKLSEEDKIFVDTISKTLQFSKKDTKKLEKIIQEFLKENNFESLNDMHEGDYLNEEACLTETVEDTFNLNEMECMTFSCELMEKVISPENYKPVVDRYQKDYGKFEQICNKYNIGLEDRLEGYYTLKDSAEFFNIDSVFDVIKKEKNHCYEADIINLQDAVKLSDEDFEEFLIDIALASKEKTKFRIQPKKNQTGSFKVYRDIAEDFMTDKILKEYNLSTDDFKFIKNKLAKREDVKDPKENKKTAFMIAEKYNLDIDSIQNIVSIIDFFESKEALYFDKILFEKMISSSK